MKNDTHTHCPKCGATIPEDAPGGLCPDCVFERAASAASVPTGTGGRKTTPHTLEEIAIHFPDLEIIELLGVGGMGAVYKARQPQLDRIVALKILSHELASDPAFVERFNREAKMLARLSHPNIVGIFETGTAGPYCYLLMEYVDGVNLRQAMRTGGFTPAEALALVQEICAALKYAHDEGILHRDIKPENILIDTKGRVKIADFGIAKMIGEGERNDVTLTLQGSILGSPHYMAPEQFEKPGDIDQRADIYSLGVVLYEMLTGELPIGRFLPPSAKAAVDARIDAIVMRTLEKEREARFQTAEEVRTSVNTVVQNPAPPIPPTLPATQTQGTARYSLAATILTALSLVGVLAGWYFGEEYHDWGMPRMLGKSISALMIILGAAAAISGFIFGCFALGAIRRSGGTLGGLGGSIFAVATWPLLQFGPVPHFIIAMIDPDAINLSRLGHPVAFVYTILVLAITAFVLGLGLRRWARGVPDKKGGKRHPGLAIPICTAYGITLIAGLMVEYAGGLVSAKPNKPGFLFDSMAEQAKRESQILSANTATAYDTSIEESVDWVNGSPEASIRVDIHHTTLAKFRLVLDKGTGQHPQYTPVGTLVGIYSPELLGILDASEIRPIRSRIEIGTSGTQGNHGITGWLDFTGIGGTLPLESAPNEWVFDTERDHLELQDPERMLIGIATRTTRGENGQEITETLKLEINVTKR